MKKLFWLVYLLPICLMAMDYVPNQIIVQTSETRSIERGSLGLENLDNFLSEYKVKQIKPVFAKEDNKFYIIDLEENIDPNELENLRIDGVENIQPNYLNSFYLEPNDSYYEQQRINVENINLPQAWNYTTGNEEIIVAIVDSGLRFDHPDLQENIYINENEIPDDGIDNDNNGYIDDYRGWDFVDAPELSNIGIGDYYEQDNDPTDEINHGTHVAGIIGATTNNEMGVSGVLWNTKILVIRAGFNSNLGGYLQDDDAAAAVIYAADMGADVINISWGDVEYSPIIAYAINYAYREGTIVICAAGNEGSSAEHPVTYPAKLANTISVGAVDNQKRLASFSSYGSALDLVAPGQQILSTYDSSGENIYYEQSGTSMAAPFVAAATALLLSVEPDMDFHQVRTRLLTTCQDLGEQGVDNKYGHGLLDCNNMLTSEITPEVKITYPAENSGFSGSFDIYGTATCHPESEFFRYFITYTTKDDPNDGDWHNVDPNGEMYHYEPVENGYLGSFVLEELMPETEYQIKVEVVTSDHQHYSMIHRVYIDQSAPEYFPENSYIMERYYDEYNKYYLGALYDEKINLEVLNSTTNESYFSVDASKQQILEIPIQGNGITELDLKATNLCGLTTETENAFVFAGSSKTIDTNSWEQILLPKQLISIRSIMDFDENGFNEIVAIEVQPDSSRIVKTYEVSSTQVVEKHVFPFGNFFWPYDVGSMEQGQKHLLGVSISNAVIYEASPGSDYPDVSILTIDDCYGGRFVDTNGDGMLEAALSRNIEVNGINKRVITITRKFNNQFTEIDTLWNTTPTENINAFTNQIEYGDFNGDSINEILAADSDGDIMLFQNGEMIWTIRMPVGNVENMAVGDFDGDGSTDFCVGGYNFDASNEANSFSYFAMFTYSQSQGDYILMDEISFDHLENKNSLVAENLDDDEADELVILASPNIYIIDKVGNDYVPIWRGESTNTFKNVLVAIPSTDAAGPKIIAPIGDNPITSCIITPAAPFTGPATPTGFNAMPRDANSAFLSWDEDDFEYVIIYRKNNDQIEQIGTSTDNFYIDESLIEGNAYEYCIAGYDSDFDPSIGKTTLWKQVIPAKIPTLESIEMSSPYEIKIIFSENLHNNSINIQHFEVNNDIGLPISVNFLHGKKGLLLSFTTEFTDFDNYLLSVKGLQGETGIFLPDEDYSFEYQEDVTAPEIVATKVLNKNSVRIYFSETMRETELVNLPNYNLVLPAIDNDNVLSYVETGMDEDGFFSEISFTNEIKYTNQNYFIRINNVYDLAGNKISNDGNKCSFTLTDIVDLKHMIIYPNPLYLSEFHEIRFANLPLGKAGNFRIYDLAGDLVFSENFEPLTELRNYYSWNAKNVRGKNVASGMYLYFIKVGNDYKKGKLAVIR